MKISTFVLAFVAAVFLSASAFAGDNLTIPEAEKNKIKAAMVNYIKGNSTSNGIFLIQDEKIKKVRELKFDYVHKGVVKHNDGFLACVDMLEEKSVLDVDFIVNKVGDEYKVSKVAIHNVDGIKRKGHLDH